MLVKSLLDIHNDLNEFRNSHNPDIENCIIRAYDIPEKLTEAIFCTKEFED